MSICAKYLDYRTFVKVDPLLWLMGLVGTSDDFLPFLALLLHFQKPLIFEPLSRAGRASFLCFSFFVSFSLSLKLLISSNPRGF